MTYEEILARQPVSTSAGDRSAARSFAAFLTTQIEGGSLSQFNESQQRYLYKLRTRWETRGNGTDERWNAQGSRPGRPRVEKLPTRGKASKRDEELDPLLASILQKYGTPVREDV